MRIVFWSCFPGHGSVSSSMLAVASMCALEYALSVCVLQTQFNCNNLQYPFFKIKDKENVEQYGSVGMDPLLRTVKGGGINGETSDELKNCGFSFMNKRLTVYTQSTSGDGKTYLHSLAQSLPLMLKGLNQAFDAAFIDTAAGNGAVSITALTEADMIVVCLPQEFWLVNYFFTKYSFTDKKLFYLFTDYDPHDACNLKALRRMYRPLTKENSSQISHSVEYSSALNKSTLVAYFLKNYSCGSMNPSFAFMESVRDSAKKILSCAGARTFSGRT